MHFDGVGLDLLIDFCQAIWSSNRPNSLTLFTQVISKAVLMQVRSS